MIITPCGNENTAIAAMICFTIGILPVLYWLGHIAWSYLHRSEESLRFEQELEAWVQLIIAGKDEDAEKINPINRHLREQVDK